jgi:hypothetical protein
MHEVLRSKGKDWLAQNRVNVSERCDMSTSGAPIIGTVHVWSNDLFLNLVVNSDA